MNLNKKKQLMGKTELLKDIKKALLLTLRKTKLKKN